MPCRGRVRDRARKARPSDSSESGPDTPGTNMMGDSSEAYRFGCFDPQSIASFDVTILEAFLREATAALSLGVLV
jgi:hypothetical protein